MKIRLSELRSIIKEEMTRLLESNMSRDEIEEIQQAINKAVWKGVSPGTVKDWSAALDDFQKATKSPENVSMLKAAKEKVRNVLRKIIAKKESEGADTTVAADVKTAKDLLAKLEEAEKVLDEVEEADMNESEASDTKKRRDIRAAMKSNVKNPFAVYQSMVQKGYDVPPVRRRRKKKAK